VHDRSFPSGKPITTKLTDKRLPSSVYCMNNTVLLLNTSLPTGILGSLYLTCNTLVVSSTCDVHPGCVKLYHIYIDSGWMER